MAKLESPLTIDKLEANLDADSPDKIDLNFEVKFPKTNQLRVVVTPRMSGDNDATLTRTVPQATLQFDGFTQDNPVGLPIESVKWNIVLKANFDTKILNAVATGNTKETTYTFKGNIAAW